MVGNKHKNGIICTFPNCNKPMRTQKFKMHFTRAHLKDGEVYSVEHRRQYEVAREENARIVVKPELAPAVAAVPTMPTVMYTTATVENSSRVEAIIPGAAAHKDIQARHAQTQYAPLSSHLEESVALAARSGDRINDTSTSSSTIHNITTAPTPAQTPLQREQTSGTKRPVAATESSSEESVDPTSVLLMQFIALMDQRFQELVGKMGEMIDVQKDLIDTLQASNPNGQAPASAFSHAVEVVMKRRKKDTSPRSDSRNGSGNADANGGDNGFVL